MGSLSTLIPNSELRLTLGQLDICDQNQTFGILAIQAAMETTPAAARLLSSILALADISLRLLNSDGARQNAEYRLTRIDEDSRYAATLHAAAQDSTSILCLLSSCLDMVRRFILDVRGTWLEINFSEIERPPPAANERDWHLSTATYWLCLRLGTVIKKKKKKIIRYTTKLIVISCQ